MNARGSRMRLDPKHLTLQGLLQGRLFRIPYYQRAYAWETKQRSDLFDDIREIQRSIRAKRIDFIDLIESVEVDSGREGIRSDAYVGPKIRTWTDVVRALERDRGSFQESENARHKIRMRRLACQYSADKQREWTAFLTSDGGCIAPAS
jgi:hypothetical protein